MTCGALPSHQLLFAFWPDVNVKICKTMLIAKLNVIVHRVATIMLCMSLTACWATVAMAALDVTKVVLKFSAAGVASPCFRAGDRVLNKRQVVVSGNTAVLIN